MLSGRGLCDELITRPEESYRMCCVVVCDLETSRICAPYIYDISSLRVNFVPGHTLHKETRETEKTALDWNPQGYRRRGRPKKSGEGQQRMK